MRLVLLALLLFPGCSKEKESSTDSGETDTDTDSDADTDTDTDTDTGPFEDTSLSGVFTGTVVDASGTPVPDAKIAFCLGICRIADSDANGQFVYNGFHTATYSFDIKMPGTDIAPLLAPLDMEAGVDVSMSFTIFDLEADKVLPEVATDVELVPGFWVNLGKDNIDMGFSPQDTTTGVRVPVEGQGWLAHSSLASDFENGAISGMWYLEPWEAVGTPDPLHFRIANEDGWSPGTAVTVWAASYKDFAFLDAGPAAVSSDGAWIEPVPGEGGGIPVLSTVVVIDPTP